MKSSDLKALAYSLVVAEQLSFRKAAAVLGIQQSSLSRHVQALEDRLQMSLFERLPRGARLTRGGEQFLEQVRTALSEIDYAAANARAIGRGDEGHLRVGLCTTLSEGFLYKLLRRYGTDHPNVSVELREGSRRHHLTSLRERRLDVAFFAGVAEAPDCALAELWSEAIFVALPSGHRLADTPEVAWNALKDERFIVSQGECGAEIHDEVVHRFAGQGRRPEVERMFVGRDTLLTLVGLGFGVTVVSEAASLSSATDVIFRPLVAPAERIHFHAAWSPGNGNPALRQFVSLAHVLAGRPRKGTSDWTGRTA